MGLKSEHAYAQCRGCGAKFELFEVYVMSEKGKTSERLRVFRK